MERMKDIKYKIAGILVCMMLMSPILTASKNSENIDSVENTCVDNRRIAQSIISPDECDVPTWSEGDYWKYRIDDVSIDLEEEGISMHIHGSMDDLHLEVVDVSSDSYQVEVHPSTINGTGTFFGDLGDGHKVNITGELKDAAIKGKISFRKSDLGIEQVNATIYGIFKGYVKAIYIELPFALPIMRMSATINVTATLDVPMPPIEFPLNDSKVWGLPSTNITIDGTIKSPCLHVVNIAYRLVKLFLPGLIPPDLIELLDPHLPVIDIGLLLNQILGNNTFHFPGSENDTFNCTGMSWITVPAEHYYCYNISVLQGLGRMYYNSTVGNIVKMSGNFEDVPFINDVNMVLTETNR